MAKPKIENIHVDSISPDAYSDKFAIGWTIGAARFHIWAIQQRRDRSRILEGYVYKNSIAKHDEPGYFHTRQIDAESKTQAAILAEVLAVVDRDHLVSKAGLAQRAERQRNKRRAELEARRHRLEQDVIQAWRAGQLADSFNARELLELDRIAADELAGLNAEAAQ